ncbi:acyltransferase [Paenibacillus polymyxa]|uniref:acyltransferase n=1 Tax=Paenibacillus polymyxa TaxID=1406 RepID=UPI00057E1B96|nr:acyltransferase [Paenibacillus polymyxa]AIY11376.1 acyltransferase [Paenibacillus polymyxa]
MKPTTKEKIPELQLVRAMAILAVLMVHATSYATVQLTNSSLYVVYNALNVLMKYGTPVFIALSSMVLFYNYKDRPLGRQLLRRFYKLRLLYILLPYVMFSLFYFILSLMAGSTEPWSITTLSENFALKLVTGKAYTHLYYIFIMMQFYLAFPCILWLFQRYRQFPQWSIVIGLLLQWSFIISNKFLFQVQNKGSWALSYVACYMLGAALGYYYPQLRTWFLMRKEERSFTSVLTWIAIWALWLISATIHVYMWYENRLYGTSYNSLVFELMYNMYSLSSPLVLLQISFLMYRRQHSFVIRKLERLGTLSFGVYLIHPFFLLLYRQFSPHIGSPQLIHVWYAGGFLCALLCSWLVVSVIARFLPCAWILFGQLPGTGKRNFKQEERMSSPETLLFKGR